MNDFTYETLLVQLDEDGIANVVLNRPDKRNAMSAMMIAELTNVAQTLGSSEDIRAIVLSGAGDMFCAGGDLEWMKAQIEADRSTRINEAKKLALMFKELNQMPKPLIGMIHGAAFGGGLGLACICDVAIASSDTKFGLTETKLGLIPATIGPYVVKRLGEGMARRIFMSARIFGSSEAASLGLVAESVNASELDAAIDMHVRPYLSAGPKAVSAAKALALSLGQHIGEDVIDDTILRLADIWEGSEASEGIDAFLDKRPAAWTIKSPPNKI